MYLGKLVEVGPAESLYRRPLHPYTVALLASIPSPDPAAPHEPVAATIHGEPASPIDPPSGCRFRTRCPRAQDICAREEPPLRPLADDHYAACHFPVTVDSQAPEATAEQPARAEQSSTLPVAARTPPTGNRDSDPVEQAKE
jgi:peptide/nickel transport system ATP-binding protein